MKPLRPLALGAAVATMVALLPALVPAPATAFGTYNSLGQEAEHERITRVLGDDATDDAAIRGELADPRSGLFTVDDRTLDQLAGRTGTTGAVGAPDNPVDSSWIPISGLGPGAKHCDDADFLTTPGYPRTRAQATAALTECIELYDELLDWALRRAGDLVDADLRIQQRQAGLDCSFPYKLNSKPNQPAKCDVLNGLGRALHLAEDFWSHSNWSDAAAPGATSAANPPGLGRTDVPDFFRYPRRSVTIPPQLTTGCDDSVTSRACRNRVGHSALAKDNGSINSRTGVVGRPTNKYPRGQVGDNFQRAVSGARKQASQTWVDLQQAIADKYGERRGRLINRVLARDSVLQPTAALGARADRIIAGPQDVRVRVTEEAVRLDWADIPGADHQVKVSRPDGGFPDRWRTVPDSELRRSLDPGDYREIQIRAVRDDERTRVRWERVTAPGAAPDDLPVPCRDSLVCAG